MLWQQGSSPHCGVDDVLWQKTDEQQTGMLRRSADLQTEVLPVCGGEGRTPGTRETQDRRTEDV